MKSGGVGDKGSVVWAAEGCATECTCATDFRSSGGLYALVARLWESECTFLRFSVFVCKHVCVKLSVWRWRRAGVCVRADVCVAAAAALTATLSSGDKKTGATGSTVGVIKRGHGSLHSYSESAEPPHHTNLQHVDPRFKARQTNNVYVHSRPIWIP